MAPSSLFGGPSSSPIASTSRIPYSSSPSPFSTLRPLSLSRAFSSTPPSHARTSGGGSAHLIHPLLRQKLTNLSFVLAGLFSVLTVSLTMSGSLPGAPLAPGCPARRTAGATMEEERREKARKEAEMGTAWWSKGRFLDDPVPTRGTPLVPTLAPAVRPAPTTSGRALQEKAAKGEERVARPPAAVEVPRQQASRGWRGWAASEERVV
ncbi:hypothetical protein JCM8097_001246 [Rhodosporidiobolus ruineniae]